jgi:Lar family restriction alleviation protein
MTDAKTMGACPFCQSEQISTHRRESGWGFEVCCDECDAAGPIKDTRADAIAAWNRRTQAPTPEAGGDQAADEALARFPKIIAALASRPTPADERGWRPIDDGAPRDGTLFVGCNLDHPSFGSWPMYRRVRHWLNGEGEMVTDDLGGWTILHDVEPDFQEGHDAGPTPAYAIAPDGLNASVRYGWRPLPATTPNPPAIGEGV